MMVGFSHYDAGFAAITHVLEQGFRRIGFIGARMDPRVQRRFEGYRDAMKAASRFDPNLVVTTSVPTTVTLGGTLFADLLSRTPDIDAVFCVNDDLALVSCSNASSTKYRFPAKWPSSASMTWNSWRPPSRR